MSEPRQLLDQFLSQFWETAAALSSAASNHPSLAALQPLPEYAAPPLNGRVLGRIDALAISDPDGAAAF